MTPTQDDRGPTTTSGHIAVANLNAQVIGLTAQLDRTRSAQGGTALLTATGAAPLVDLLLLRGQVLGRVADYERAAELAEALVRDALNDRTAQLARARTRSTFHRFPEALADLDAAGRNGAARAELDAERAAILQAMGCHAEALALRRTAAQCHPDFTTLSALAVLHAERREAAEAERLFTAARHHYRGGSPFPIAELDHRRGLMWLGDRDLPAARTWFTAAVRRVPAYAPAVGHLAQVDAALGDLEAAIDRLRPLAVSSDDPEIAATLAGVLRDAGRPAEAEHWRTYAATRYDELVRRHPGAFLDHAADFWLTVGGDPQRGLRLIERDLTHSHAATTHFAAPSRPSGRLRGVPPVS